ncbi:MAG: hypothetical protein QMD92_04790 [bacterium]|nr:hypothetical protein [bacterium]
MEIILNGQNLDFELENEKTLSEVLLAIGKWTAETNSEVITSIRLNEGEEILPEEGFKSKKPLKEINKVELETVRIVELSIDGLIELLDYFPQLKSMIKKTLKAIEKKDEKKLKNLVEKIINDVDWAYALIEDIYESMQVEEKTIFLEEKAVKKEKEILNNIKQELIELLAKNKTEELGNLLKEQLYFHIDEWLKLFPKLIECFRNIKGKEVDSKALFEEIEEIKKFKNRLNALSSNLVNVSVKMQTGDDIKAMEMFQGDITILEDLISLVQNIQRCFNLNYSNIKVNDKSIEEEILTLKNMLGEIIMAFENNDIVMLCDLLEYELSPLSESWLDILNKLEEEIKSCLN